MSLHGEQYGFPERHTLDALAETHHNVLRMYDSFYQESVINTPVSTRAGSSEQFHYDVLTFFGVVQNGAERRTIFAVREASEVVLRNSPAAASYVSYKLADRQGHFKGPRRMPPQIKTLASVPEKFGYYVATTDGIQTDEWSVAHTYWRNNPKLGDELVLTLGRPKDSAVGTEFATMWLSRLGGTFKLPHNTQSGWLIGDSTYSSSPRFLNDPRQA